MARSATWRVELSARCCRGFAEATRPRNGASERITTTSHSTGSARSRCYASSHGPTRLQSPRSLLVQRIRRVLKAAEREAVARQRAWSGRLSTWRLEARVSENRICLLDPGDDDLMDLLREIASQPCDGLKGERLVEGRGCRGAPASPLNVARGGTPLHHICTTNVGGRGSSTVTKGHVQRPDDLHYCQIDQVAAVGGTALIRPRFSTKRPASTRERTNGSGKPQEAPTDGDGSRQRAGLHLAPMVQHLRVCLAGEGRTYAFEQVALARKARRTTTSGESRSVKL